ncbi:hypothetical protein [Zhengella mangrovi]|uniref:hypothetical protein n=1 Tax=Zhengella mangrovi TaxID=1982044 RepID=UPI0013FDF4F2|nr:hypothetical protein [Zhengella mangrovi]
MGFTPRQVDEMPVWEFMACRDGYAEMHGLKNKAAPEPSGALLSQLGIDDGN